MLPGLEETWIRDRKNLKMRIIEQGKSAYQEYRSLSILGHKQLLGFPGQLFEKINPKRVVVKLFIGGFKCAFNRAH